MIRLVRLNEVQYVASEFETNELIDDGFVVQELEPEKEPEVEPEKAPAKKGSKKDEE